MTEHVKMEASGGVMIMTLPRPEKKNALTGAKYDAPLRIRHARALRDVCTRATGRQGRSAMAPVTNCFCEMNGAARQD